LDHLVVSVIGHTVDFIVRGIIAADSGETTILRRSWPTRSVAT
jgi:hypothetical protein